MNVVILGAGVFMGDLKHCGRCQRTTAFVEGKCQRCAFKRAHAAPMDDAAKARLKAANEKRRLEREARKRDNQTNNTEER